MPAATLRTISLVQPLMLTVIAGIVGALLAPRLEFDASGFRAVVRGQSPSSTLRGQAGPALLAGLGVGLLLGAYGFAFEAFINAAGAEAKQRAEAVTPPLIVRVLYGGITEEIIARWGAMTLIVWVLWRLSGRPPHPSRFTVWFGILLSACLFSVGHVAFPTAAFDPPHWIVLAALTVNVIAGLAFGFLYQLRGLEAAMMSHILAHVLAAGISGKF